MMTAVSSNDVLGWRLYLMEGQVATRDRLVYEQSRQGGAMTTIMPQGELMRRAVKWIDERRAQTGQPLPGIIDMAALQFNLSPKDSVFLEKFFREHQEIPKD